VGGTAVGVDDFIQSSCSALYLLVVLGLEHLCAAAAQHDDSCPQFLNWTDLTSLIVLPKEAVGVPCDNARAVKNAPLAIFTLLDTIANHTTPRNLTH